MERHLGRFAGILLLSGAQPLPGLSFPDEVEDIPDPEAFCGAGPMAGILAGLNACSTDWLAVLPIDQPFFDPRNFLPALEQSAATDEVLGFLDSTGREQWVPGLFHRRLKPAVQVSLEADQRSLGQFVRGVPHRFLPVVHGLDGSPDGFTNLNTPEQAAAAGFQWPATASTD